MVSRGGIGDTLSRLVSWSENDRVRGCGDVGNVWVGGSFILFL